MRVGIDGTPLTVPTGGIRRYTIELSRALGRLFPEDQYAFFSDQSIDASQGIDVFTGRPRSWLQKRWWSYGLNRALSEWRAEIFHGTDFAVPYLRSLPSVMTLHDLSPWMDRDWHCAADRVRRRAPFLIRLITTMVITPTEAVRRAAIERFGIAPERIVAVPHAAAEHFRPVQEGSRRRARPYFLYVGTLEPRKNLPFLIECWRTVRTQVDIDLVVVGRRREDCPAIAAEPGLVCLGDVPEDDLPALYSLAVACVYPSFYEGFGLPVLEAMQCGTAVIGSSDAAIGEVAGDAAVRLDSTDRSGWITAMLRAATDRQWNCGYRDRALRRAAEFSWERTARKTKEVYEEAIRRFRA